MSYCHAKFSITDEQSFKYFFNRAALMNSNHLSSLLKLCMKSKALRPGKQIHAHIVASGDDPNIGSLNSSLVGVYAGCGDLHSARKTFELLPKQSTFMWNWMISSSAFQGHCHASFEYFSQMQGQAFPNKFTFSAVAKACVGLMDVKIGEQVHGIVSKMGFQNEVLVLNALVDMYSKCGRLDFSRKVFDEMPERDVASWTCIISGYSQGGKFEESLLLLGQMKAQGFEPNEFTWNSVLTGYAQSGDCNRAFEIFCTMRNEGLRPDLVTWNAMIAGFSRNCLYIEAITLFRDMLVSGLQPNAVTIAGLLPGCGNSGSIHRGRQVHGLIYRRCLNFNAFIASALIDMYSKRGSVRNARLVFDQTMGKNVASWNAMIGCYGKHGLVDESIQLFESMQDEGMEANQVTFTSILSACSHAGLVEKGLKIFSSMTGRGVEPCKEHYACVVDLLCRAGRLKEAYDMVEGIFEEVNDSIIGAFFNGCRIHGEIDIARKMAEKILRMELKRPGGYVTLSNIYAADGRWDWVERLRRVMRQKRVCKKAGVSWVERKDGFVG
ncbi:hypothetical protein Sjap_012689 [Stephania japonica]|uniref:Pentatricopeptide repeat-containing protein n=1 Tax=Stephania japonica TaxID=461633 RepID=A0AAP0IWD4_9MAGN